jgi:hypothetical protein
MRLWHKVVLATLLLLLLLLAAGYWYGQKALAALPLKNLKVDIKSFNLRQIELNLLSFSPDAIDATIELRDLRISWQYGDNFTPELSHLVLGSGDITIAQWPAADDSSVQQPSLSMPLNWQLPDGLPESVLLTSLNISLPCARGRCDYQFDADMQRSADQVRLKLHAIDPASPDSPGLTLNADYQIQQQLPLLNAKLQLDNSVTLSLSQQLQQQSILMADGELTLVIAPPSPWLIQQFQHWQLELPPEALQQFTAPVTLQSRWQFELPEQIDLASLSQRVSGNLQLNADLPTPFSIPSVGQLQGTLQAELALTQGELSRYWLNSELILLQPQLPTSVLQHGVSVEELAISLHTDGKTTPQLTALPLHIALNSKGKSQLTFSVDAKLNLTPPFSAMLRGAKLQVTQEKLAPQPGLSMQKIKLDSSFDAYWLADSWQVQLHSAKIKLARLQLADSSASDLQLSLQPSQFSGDSRFSSVQLHTELQLNAQQLQHPLLKPLNWQWQGKLQGDLNQLTAEGKLSNSADLALSHQLLYQPDKLQLNWQLEEMFLLAGNPLQKSLTQWPALLEFNRGRINGSGAVSLTPQLALQATVNLSGVSGIYDRSLFKELTAPLQLHYQGDDITLSTTDTSLNEIQHGLIAGPLKLTASYRADATTPQAGVLDIKQLHVLAMGGQVNVQPVRLDLAMDKHEVILQLQRIDLAQLLQQHPTTDLSGNGRISGTVPVQITRNGVSVKQGYVAAESPGGILQYRPPAAKNMASGNQGMKVVLDALDDFHYSVLSSDVSYDTEGQLTLALNLKGHNPALEAGRAVNLNINLEEDIPALITSLQLSSQISDKIKQRVQQHLQQSGAKGANGVKL